MHPCISHLFWESLNAFLRLTIGISSLERYQFLHNPPTHRLVTAEIPKNCCLTRKISISLLLTQNSSLLFDFQTQLASLSGVPTSNRCNKLSSFYGIARANTLAHSSCMTNSQDTSSLSQFYMYDMRGWQEVDI